LKPELKGKTALVTGAAGTMGRAVVAFLREARRLNVAGLGELPVITKDYVHVPLSRIAQISVVDRVGTITRENTLRRVAVLINVRGRDTESFVKEAGARLHEELKLPAGYYVEFGGQFENLQAARTRLAILVPATLAMIFVLIYASFGRARQALLVFTGIPLAVTGGVLALWLRGIPFSISAGVGFIALSGVAVLNGVMIVSFFNQLRERGHTVRESVLEGALIRLRPVMMTAFVASLGFLPMAIATGPGAEVQRPLATVVIGGIISATFLTLVLLPALYDFFERDTKPVQQ
jgi:cobalt-zinc-cadmium resistance protein CzcA